MLTKLVEHTGSLSRHAYAPRTRKPRGQGGEHRRLADSQHCAPGGSAAGSRRRYRPVLRAGTVGVGRTNALRYPLELRGAPGSGCVGRVGRTRTGDRAGSRECYSE